MRKPRKKLLLFGLIAASLAVLLLLPYLQFKKTLLARVSDRMTLLVGQNARVRDVLLGPGGICVSGVEIDDAGDFGGGKLLQVRRLCADLRYQELLRGRFSFRRVLVENPRLRIVRDGQGRMNVSAKLRALLAEKGTSDYRIDLLEVSDAAIDMNLPGQRAVRDLSVVMKDLSSSQGTKTSCRVSCRVPDIGTVTADGWFVLDNGPRAMNLDIKAEELSLAAIAGLAGLSLPDRKLDFKAHAEGDVSGSVSMSAELRVREGSFFAFFRKRGELRGRLGAVWDRTADSVKITNAEVASGDDDSVSLSGMVRHLSARPVYETVLKIPRFDLAALPVKKDQSLGGELSCEGLVVRGAFEKGWPAVEGAMRLKNGSWKSPEAVLDRIEAVFAFLGSDNSARAEVSAEISRAGDVTFSRPLPAKFTIDVERVGNGTRLSSAVTAAGIEANRAGRRYTLEKAGLKADGTLTGRTFSGRLALDADGLLIGERRVMHADASSDISVKKDEVSLGDLSVKADKARLTASRITMTPVQGSSRYVFRLNALNADLPVERFEAKGLAGSVEVSQDSAATNVSYALAADKASLYGITVNGLSGSGKVSDKAVVSILAEAEIAKGRARLSLRGRSASAFFPLDAELSLNGIDAAALSGMIASSGEWQMPYQTSGKISQFAFHGALESWGSVRGSGTLKAERLGLAEKGGRFLVRDVGFQAAASFEGKDMKFQAETRAQDARLVVEGQVKRFGAADRLLSARITIPETSAQNLRTAFWDACPDRLLYAGLEGMLSADIVLTSNAGETLADGSLVVRDLTVSGENGEFDLGPVNGTVPVLYRRQPAEQDMAHFQGFDRESFSQTRKRFAMLPDAKDKPELTVGSFRYGFRLLEDIRVWMRPEGSLLNVDRFSATIFGGKISGIARIALSEKPDYRVAALLDDMSLETLCNEVEPIRGYISGRISGTALLRGNGMGLGRLTGKADFWTHETQDEKTRMSREFLEKLGGPTVRAYLGERRFDRGVMSLYIQDGFLTFRELEISNRNFIGVQDLSVKVAPLSNRIAIEHLLWTIVQAAERAKSK